MISSISSPRKRTTTFRHTTTWTAALLLATLAAPASSQETEAAGPRDSGDTAGIQQQVDREGITIDVAMEPIERTERPRGGADFQEGDTFRVRLKISDSHTGTALGSLYPAAWLDRLPEGADPLDDGPKSCQDKVEAFIGGALLAQPEIDLNVYYVLAMNDEATISVVDPLFGFGGSKLLDMVFLESPGDDWQLTEDQRRLFVSMPGADRVAVVDTATWKVIQNIDVGPRPRRLALQRDERYLWVAWDGDGEKPSGVSVIDTAELSEVARLETGRGRHELALGGDRTVWVSNGLDGTVSAIDVHELRKVADVATGPAPRSLAYSGKSRALYVSHPDGTVAIVDDTTRELVGRAETDAGLDQIRFAPGERLAFAVNPVADSIHILDVASGRFIQAADVEKEPFEVAFSDEIAYVAHRGSEIVLMIPLGQLGQEGAPVPVIDFPGGQHPPGRTRLPASAGTMVQAPGATAVLVANPADGVIYYYKEGMAAPMGHFKNYGRMPRAVQVVDRSLKETAPGVYETTAKLLEPGRYDLAVFVDAPRTIKCFGVEVAASPERLAAERARRKLDVRNLSGYPELTVGQATTLRFELTDPETGTPRRGLDDVNVLTFLAPGVWQQRHWATEAGDGVYELEFTPPRPGVYYVFLQVESMGLSFNQSRSLVLQAKKSDATSGDAAP